MLRQVAINALQARFGDVVSVRDDPQEFAVFPAKHPEVGDLFVADDSDELTIYIGEITHGHFNVYGDDLTEEEHAEAIAEDLVEFLVDLFDDKYFLYKGRWGDGWSRAELVKDSDLKSRRTRWFMWSGPINSGKPD